LEKLVDAATYQPLLTMDHIMAPLLTRSTALVEVNHGLDTMKFDMCTTVADLEAKTDLARTQSRPIFAYALVETLHISLVFNRPAIRTRDSMGRWRPRRTASTAASAGSSNT